MKSKDCIFSIISNVKNLSISLDQNILKSDCIKKILKDLN